MSNLPIYSMCSTHASYPQPCSLWTPFLFNYTCFRYEMAAGKKNVPRGLLSQEWFSVEKRELGEEEEGITPLISEVEALLYAVLFATRDEVKV